MKIGILGIGAIGSVIAIELNKNKSLECFFFNRSKKDKILLKSNEQLTKLPIQLSNSQTFQESLDWLIICIKANHYTIAKAAFQKLITSNTKVAVIRNGLNLKDPILEFTKEENILECIIDCPTQAIGNGLYECLGHPIITCPPNPIIEDFNQLFLSTNLRTETSLDFNTTAWKKVCESSAIGAILCLSGATAWVFKDPEVQSLYSKIMEEAIQVAKADGAVIDANFKHQMTQKLLKYPNYKGSSMLTDRQNGKPIELEAKNKIICDTGKKYNIDTPVNDMVCILLKHTNNSAPIQGF